MASQLRHVLTPSASRKRKEREDFDAFIKPSITAVVTTNSKADKPASSNQLLAGYLAHEFLTQRTLFGQIWDPARAEAFLVSADSAESKAAPPPLVKNQRYGEVARLLKMDGAHIQDVVNPTQLAQWIQM
ncbi:hypothetical protein HHK36_022498 [Tetracentron sinense]|uniref:Uncharacterized protein n=1 Tax=Tetracentron sinense TaxID=13715 RepID=A0A834YS17_TETSI|nr:hypothetical protein HHK36_022498 [Tetracentron sinense]